MPLTRAGIYLSPRDEDAERATFVRKEGSTEGYDEDGGEEREQAAATEVILKDR